MSLWYDPDTDTVIKDTNPGPGGGAPSGANGDVGYDHPSDYPGTSFGLGSTPPSNDDLPVDPEGRGYGYWSSGSSDLRPGAPPKGSDEDRIQTTVVNEVKTLAPGLSDADVGALGIRVLHELGAKQGLSARDFVDLYSGKTSDEIKSAVDRALNDITTGVDRNGERSFDFARGYMEELYAPRPDSSAFYGIGEKPPTAPALSLAAPVPTSFAAIRHDPDLLERYYRARDYQLAQGMSLTDTERQKLADDIASGALWEPLDELREKQLRDAAEFYSPKVPPAEDYATRHPGFPSNVVYNPSRPGWGSPTLTLSPRPMTDPSLWAGATGIGDTVTLQPKSPGRYAPPLKYGTTPTLGPTHLFKFEGQWYDSNTGQFINHINSPLWDVIDQLAAQPRPARQVALDLLKSTYGTGHLPDDIDPYVGGMALANLRGVGASKGDKGFRPEFQDDDLYAKYWGKKTPHSTQVGHFLTALDMGLNGTLPPKKEVIGHEQYSDQNPINYAGFAIVSDEDVAAFDAAVAGDLRGDTATRDEWLSRIFDETQFGSQANRYGNSMEDLALSVKGWELGREIATGQLRSGGDIADWIIRNVADWWY